MLALPSYRVLSVGSASAAAAAVARSLREQSVSVVVLQRDAVAHSPKWGDVKEVATRMPLSAAAASGAAMEERLAAVFDFVPDEHRSEMRELLQLFANVAQEAGGANPNTQLNCRLEVSHGSKGKCPRFHFDKVSLRLTVSLRGEGTRWLPQSAINRAGLTLIRRKDNLPKWLQRVLLEPYGWRIYNSFICYPWLTEQRTRERECVLMKGSRWPYGRAEHTSLSRRALPAIHRSPIDQTSAERLNDPPRLLFTIDMIA